MRIESKNLTNLTLTKIKPLTIKFLDCDVKWHEVFKIDCCYSIVIE